MLLTAEQQIGQIDVALIVEEGTAVDPAGVQSMGDGDGGGGHAVPFILATAMQVDIGLT
jgi:hypothetical protein